MTECCSRFGLARRRVLTPSITQNCMGKSKEQRALVLSETCATFFLWLPQGLIACGKQDKAPNKISLPVLCC